MRLIVFQQRFGVLDAAPLAFSIQGTASSAITNSASHPSKHDQISNTPLAAFFGAETLFSTSCRTSTRLLRKGRYAIWSNNTRGDLFRQGLAQKRRVIAPFENRINSCRRSQRVHVRQLTTSKVEKESNASWQRKTAQIKKRSCVEEPVYSPLDGIDTGTAPHIGSQSVDQHRPPMRKDACP